MSRSGNELNNASSATIKKVRSSNLELFRIISMLLIIAHHYVVNSGLSSLDGPLYDDNFSVKSIIMFLFGAWGKTGINCFMMITGYFMCTSHITAKKYAKLLFEVFFYKIVIYLIFLCTGLETFSFTSLVENLLIIRYIKHNFTGCFLVFYLFIPFLNILIKNINEKQHIRLLALLGFTYIFLGTMPKFSVTMNYVSWFMVLYFIASYIRLYPKEIFSKKVFWGAATIISMLLSVVSVIGCAWISIKTGTNRTYMFVTDSNTVLAVITGVSAFMFFRNLKVPYSKFINTLGASTFGVLLIHGNGNVRYWLWYDLLNNTGVYKESYVFIHAVLSVIGIFTVCTIIDALRIRFIESPTMKCWDKHYDSIKQWYERTENKILKKLNVK
ncbi:MAG: acyltransferase [Oscillospiraceae bacterium]|nr:acyltransferase [Oscillospiraceae bacterium]